MDVENDLPTLNFKLETRNSPHGLLNVVKPTGVSSRHVVTQLEQALAPLAVGHAGTLDPLASGVLVVGVGRGTKLVDYLHRFPKTYVASFLLGRSSDTEDVTGQVVLETNPRVPTRAELETTLPRFLGATLQTPPAFSALKVRGRRAYKLARKGKSVELQPRPIVVHRFQILRYEHPELEVEIECSTGTYVRSLGRDLARAVGTEAVMATLSRISIGPFTLAEAVSPEAVSRENLAAVLKPSVLAVANLTQVNLTDAQADQLASTGVVFDLPLFAGDFPAGAEIAGIASDGRLFAVLTPSKGDRWKVKTMLG